MKEYTVSQLAKLSGLTVRTLHHYDVLDLLTPCARGENGYRYYGSDELRRLQQILFHRAFGIELKSIATLLDLPPEKIAARLKGRREEMALRLKDSTRLLATLDLRIAELEGNGTMRDKDIYSGLVPEKQKEYEKWLYDGFGENIDVRMGEAHRRFDALDATQKAEVFEELRQVEHAIAEAMRNDLPADDPMLDLPLGRHRAWVAFMWGRECTTDAYAGLADIYLEHPGFVGRYEAIAEDFTPYMTKAMKAYAERIG